MLEEHGNVTLVVDIMYISEIPLIIMMSTAIHFSTIEMIKDKRSSTIMKPLQQVINKSHSRGFKIRHIRCHSQFECISWN